MEEDIQIEEGGTRQWLADNLRIIISIIIVIAIAGGIYSYSKRTDQAINIDKEQDATEEIAISTDNENSTADDTTTTPSETKGEEKTAVAKTEPVATSQETDNSFVETAVKGNGLTHLSRRALANYLEKNPDSELKAEHKIFIEDYLRKKSSHQERVFTGTSVEFSKEMIKEAITKAKQLNERQLKNLSKYAQRVPSLS